jgi:hypothetical protein
MPAREGMALHVDVLGWLHVIWGVLGVLLAVALGVLAAGTGAALAEEGSIDRSGQAVVALFVLCGTALALLGLMMIGTGRGLHHRRRVGRLAALVLAVPNLVLVPFGTALGLYTFWVLVNDDARGEFGRPPRSGRSAGITSVEGA